MTTKKQGRASAYPLHLDPELRAAAQKLADEQDRSLHWTLVQLIRIALRMREGGAS